MLCLSFYVLYPSNPGHSRALTARETPICWWRPLATRLARRKTSPPPGACDGRLAPRRVRPAHGPWSAVVGLICRILILSEPAERVKRRSLAWLTQHQRHPSGRQKRKGRTMWDDSGNFFLVGAGPTATVLDPDNTPNNILDVLQGGSFQVNWSFSGPGAPLLTLGGIHRPAIRGPGWPRAEHPGRPGPCPWRPGALPGNHPDPAGSPRGRCIPAHHVDHVNRGRGLDAGRGLLSTARLFRCVPAREPRGLKAPRAPWGA